jgi:hypothetical protein
LAQHFIYLKEKIMRNRFRKYIESKRTSPIKNKGQIPASNDKHIDQDYTGFPHSPATEGIINPKTEQEKKVAAVNIKDGEKMDIPKYKIDEQESDGSGGAFSSTEELIDDEE